MPSGQGRAMKLLVALAGRESDTAVIAVAADLAHAAWAEVTLLH